MMRLFTITLGALAMICGILHVWTNAFGYNRLASAFGGSGIVLFLGLIFFLSYRLFVALSKG